jgi:two-component system LytT family sensor kinase
MSGRGTRKMKGRLDAFWILHASGWLVYTGVSVIFHLQERRAEASQIFPLLVTYGLGFVSCIPLRAFYRKIRLNERPLWRSIVTAAAASFVGANLWRGMELMMGLFLKQPAASPWMVLQAYAEEIFPRIILLAVWTFLYLAIKTGMEWRRQEARREKANFLAQDAQLRMLRYQLNPHFLFNSLNSIRALIDEDEMKAREMITELSEFLRYSLDSKEYANVPLKHEIEAIRHYFAIQKKRYEDKLEIIYDIEPNAGDYPVLSFLIHPLVENAVKYGMRTSPIPLIVRLTAKTSAAGLMIEVCNTGRWGESERPENQLPAGTGTGLDNVRRRLENAFPDRHRLDFFEKEGCVHVRLEISDPRGVIHEKAHSSARRR